MLVPEGPDATHPAPHHPPPSIFFEALCFEACLLQQSSLGLVDIVIQEISHEKMQISVGNVNFNNTGPGFL